MGGQKSPSSRVGPKGRIEASSRVGPKGRIEASSRVGPKGRIEGRHAAAVPPKSDTLQSARTNVACEATATEWEVMAFLAHRTAKEASRFTAAANRSMLTMSGMARLSTKPEQFLSNLPSKLGK